MKQSTGRHESHANSEDEDVPQPRSRQPEHEQHKRGAQPRQPVGQPDGDVPGAPDEPDEPEFALIGDDDLSPADLGPAAPNATDPDADSGRIRKIAR
jgi:hypothetical protein